MNKAHHTLVLAVWISPAALADQPIMNMMPRWDGGYGWQVLYEYKHLSDLKQGSSVIRKGWSETIHQVHIQGVYTWDRSIRITAKLPIVLDAERENLLHGRRVVQRDRGLGDLTLAVPLKHYFNLPRRAGNWTLAPQMRVPLASKDEYDVWDHVWGSGLSAGYETETRRWFFAADATYWTFIEGEPEEWHASLDTGWNFRDNAQLLWENDAHHATDGTAYYAAGPALYWRWNDHTHLRASWKHDFYSKASRDTPDHGNGDSIILGIGFVH